MTDGDRCTGHCCRSFSLGPPDEFVEIAKKRIEEHEAKGETYEANDYRTILGMVLYRGLMKNPHELFDRFTGMRDQKKEPWHFYTCKHFIEHADGTGSCGNYEARPDMCRRYPYESTCEYSSCTWEKWKPKVNAARLLPASTLVRKAILVEKTQE